MKQQFSFKNYTSYGSYGSTSSPVPILERVTQYMIHMVTYGYLTHPHIQLDQSLTTNGISRIPNHQRRQVQRENAGEACMFGLESENERRT